LAQLYAQQDCNAIACICLRNSVCQSVGHTRGSVKNGAS